MEKPFASAIVLQKKPFKNAMVTRKEISERTYFHQAKDLEASEQPGNLSKAASFYEKVLRTNPIHIDANNRLMIVYRKLGESAKELSTIKSAIKHYQQHIDDDRKVWMQHHKAKAKDSAKLAEAMGLLDAKGKPKYRNEILDLWIGRLTLLEARIKKNKTLRAKLTAKRKAKKTK
ncbi:hypothetical protein [Pedobacter aquatilis]|uniref:tetratricopeptide repeat protein n=1 Tax=Pedobacter aquatilis TaxID=351343 RepID=UPI00292F2DE0|nr:hypothetical protein [Pedobacter aquatilis]